MISHPLLYLFSLASIVTVFYLLESKTSLKVFKLIPIVVFIYATSMLFAAFGLFDVNAEINSIYKQTKTNLLPAMLFLMLLQLDLKHFLKLGKSLLIAYVLAVVSIALGFIVVAILFDFTSPMSGAFGALAGSWLGGTANMIAVGSALNVTEEAFAYALVVDSINYTLWVMLLLFLVPFAHKFNKFTKSSENLNYLTDIACACNMGTKRYWLLILLALGISFLTQYLSSQFVIINTTTSMVIFASVLGVIGSFTKLRDLNGSSELSTSMLYLLIALIGSHAVIESFSGLALYVLAGGCILFIHALIM
ncbi:MAG: DUF819 family protein, partial [Sulfurimonas sp.]|nr:DUF819 family protein [Sulfurimonas sp.]